MLKLLCVVILLVFICCNSTDNKSVVAETDVKTEKAPVSYAYPVNYSSEFEIGDPEKAKIILDLWKNFDNNTLDNVSPNLADTVTMLFPGMEMTGSRDSILSSTKSYRNSYSAVTSKVDAIMSAKSIDKKDDWVLVWGTEIHTDKKNKIDSVHLQETWRFNKDGKVDFMMQYARQPAAPMKQ